MEILRYQENQLPKIVLKTLKIMEQKGVSEQILSDLTQDNGFIKFCIEWVAQRWDSQIIENDISITNQIRTLKEKIQSLTQLIREMRSQNFKIFEEEINSQLKDLESSIFLQRFNHLNDDSNSEDLFSDFYLDLNSKPSKQLCKTLRKHKIPNFKSLNIDFSKSASCDRTFLQSSFPNQTNKLALNNYDYISNEIKIKNISRYFREITRVIARVARLVHFYNFEISQTQLTKLLSCCRDKPELEFYSCKIHTETSPDLSKLTSEWKIEQLSFDFCGKIDCCNWKLNLGHFENLIGGISTSESLCQSLKNLSIRVSCVPREDYIRIMQNSKIGSYVID
ncbi:unnamed protein product [Moneuplotes crassus]|uniref:Uncharacterized protein n=1 Tax=Euplotes crassus TaxID=5936 RepID=A0AAD1XMG3_EUPCR|nr:unnamed protein product [Moneuplotes crassus]